MLPRDSSISTSRLPGACGRGIAGENAPNSRFGVAKSTPNPINLFLGAMIRAPPHKGVFFNAGLLSIILSSGITISFRYVKV